MKNIKTGQIRKQSLLLTQVAGNEMPEKISPPRTLVDTKV